MHRSSLEKMALFRNIYAVSLGPARVLDVGSMTFASQPSFREVFRPPAYEYVGMDVAEGPNVDFVPKNIYEWRELHDESFEIVVSGQSLEHNPFFWMTLAEINRVTRVGGLICLVVPSRGPIHRYPVDCWRFLPDSYVSLVALLDATPIEVVYDSPRWNSRFGNEWGDLMLVCRKDRRTTQLTSQHLGELVLRAELIEPGGPISAAFRDLDSLGILRSCARSARRQVTDLLRTLERTRSLINAYRARRS